MATVWNDPPVDSRPNGGDKSFSSVTGDQLELIHVPQATSAGATTEDSKRHPIEPVVRESEFEAATGVLPGGEPLQTRLLVIKGPVAGVQWAP